VPRRSVSRSSPKHANSFPPHSAGPPRVSCAGRRRVMQKRASIRLSSLYYADSYWTAAANTTWCVRRRADHPNLGRHHPWSANPFDGHEATCHAREAFRALSASGRRTEETEERKRRFAAEGGVPHCRALEMAFFPTPWVARAPRVAAPA